jgi:P-type Ca2+ transporter type 2C
MATLNQIGDERHVFITGAPERVLQMCHKQYTSKGEVGLDLAYWEQKIEFYASKGKRMLGIGYCITENNRSELEKDYMEKHKVMLGIVGIIDPPRDEVIDAIKACKSAGVQVKMITGDHVITAKAIGEAIGICENGKAMSGKELEEMTDAELQEVCEDFCIYARTTPEHKLRLVTALQAKEIYVQ